jgi:hypothetical protein
MRLTGFTCGVFLFLLTASSWGQTPEKPGPASQPRQVEVRFRDDSRLKVILQDERIEFETRFGRLTVPLAEIHGLELGARVPDELIERVQAAVKKLGSCDFKDREAAAAELVKIGVQALPAVMAARDSSDAEIANRARQVVDKITEAAEAEELEQKSFDVLLTADSKITGRVIPSTLKALTPHFGVQTIKLADALSVRSLDALEDEGDDKQAEPDPGNLVNYRDRIGKILAFRVTGQNVGTVWGSDIYTSDSSLATAAVHAGALKLGQTGIVRVKIVPAPATFSSSARNGILSHPWSGHLGAFQVMTRRMSR